jgi:hypothetical protein
MRNRNEVMARIEELIPSSHDPFGVMVGCLIGFLRYRDAHRFLKKDVDQESWNASRFVLSDDNLHKMMAQGARTAWMLANARKGVESNKGFMALECLCWLFGPADHAWAVRTFWTRGIMAHYGKPQLVELHERYRLGPWQELDDGRWHNSDYGIDLSADQAMRQWRARWMTTRLSVVENNGKED